MFAIADIHRRLTALGANEAHVGRVLRHWVQARPLTEGRRKLEHYLPQAVREALPALMDELHGLATLVERHPGEDGSARLLVRLVDGQTVESVLLPRDGLCVSSQVGCAVGCRFCMTGKDGLLRQVTSAEIVAQVALARRERPVKKVVFMGMGEPSHNLEAVMEAIELLGLEGNLGHKHLVFSTVGDLRAFERLAAGPVKPALALSLHTTKPELRRELLPRAPRLTPRELVDAGERYARETGYPIQYQWTLIEGVNDGEDELDGIVELLKGKYGVLNMIPYNSVPELPYVRPDWDKARDIARRLHQRGVLTKLRDSAGQDVDGGCGQLRARSLDATPTSMREARRSIPIAPAG
ncbi:RNA methyltransferase [Mitsuaria sp. 7]|uniref:RNA methyltransferase n=1 Tax=Mitsuaria sp. 7 TaxID=1658665 RepID=UPI000AC354A3|nr:RNA methyltransferase [Mitsuaria sp. 7]